MIQDFENSPIFVTGVQRSGNSIIAHIIQACGVFNGRTNNMFENTHIKKLIDSYYRELHIDVRGQFPLPDTRYLKTPDHWKTNVLNCLKTDAYDSTQQWMYKNSRISQLWPVWHKTYPNAKWVIVRRRTGAVISSCMNTAYMNAYKDKEIQKIIGVSNENDGWLWWIHQHEELFKNMIKAGVNYRIVWPEKMVYGDYQEIVEMIQWLGLTWDDSLIKLIEPLLWNTKKKEGLVQ